MIDSKKATRTAVRCVSEHSAAADCPTGGMLGHYFWAAAAVTGLAFSLKPLVAGFIWPSVIAIGVPMLTDVGLALNATEFWVVVTVTGVAVELLRGSPGPVHGWPSPPCEHTSIWSPHCAAGPTGRVPAAMVQTGGALGQKR